MNVNKKNRQPRKRRTAEEARALILDAAERRLQDHGLGGLNIVDVGRDAGVSHATVIHHFGSTEAMRQALVARMSERLIRDFLATFDDEGQGGRLTGLFDAMSSGGHAKLLAWLAVESIEREAPTDATRALFDDLIARSAGQLPPTDPDAARNIIMLVAVAAVGWGIAGATLGDLLKMNEAAMREFPDWLAGAVGSLAG